MAILIVGGDTIFAKLKIQPPSLYNIIKEHKVMAGMMVFMLGNLAKGYFTNTGAFEVYINGALVCHLLELFVYCVQQATHHKDASEAD